MHACQNNYPPGLSRSDGKRPDGATARRGYNHPLVLRETAQVVWDATCPDTFSCSSYLSLPNAGAVASRAEYLIWLPLTFLSLSHLSFISLGKRIASAGDPKSTAFLLQRLSARAGECLSCMITGLIPERTCLPSDLDGPISMSKTIHVLLHYFAYTMPGNESRILGLWHRVRRVAHVNDATR